LLLYHEDRRQCHAEKDQKEKEGRVSNVFMQCGIGMALDKLNNKIARSVIICRWKQQHATAKLITTEMHPFQTQFRKMAYIDFIKRFNQFRPKKEEQFLWVDVTIGHNEANEDFQQIAFFALDDWSIWLYPIRFYKKLKNRSNSVGSFGAVIKLIQDHSKKKLVN
jgi:hypothetical protein